VEGD
jgi:hypothetical protein